MLAGLRFEKGKDAKEEEKKDKKTKKKERKKEQKKRKKREKKKKKDDKASSSASSDSSAEVTNTATAAPGAASPAAAAPRSSAAAAAAAFDAGMSPPKAEAAAKNEVQGLGTEDFFSSLGTARKKKDDKPDPDRVVVHSMELNPLLQGKELTVRATVAGDGGCAIPKQSTVGDGGAAWRNRAKRRAAQAAAEAAGEAPPPLLRKLGGEQGPPGEGKPAPRRDRSKSRKKSRSRSRGREQSNRGRRSRSADHSRQRQRERRSPSPQRKRGNRSPTPQRKRGERREASRSRSRDRSRSGEQDKAATRGRGSAASTDWCKDKDEQILRERAKQSADDDMEAVLRKLQSKYDGTAATAAAAKSSEPAGSAVEDGPEDGNELAAMAMQAMLSGDMELYEKLNGRLEKKQAEEAAKEKATAAPTVVGSSNFTRGPNGERVEIIEEIDAAGRHRSLVESVQSASLGTGQKGAKKLKGVGNVGPDGKGKVKESGFYADDDISLQDLIRREKIEGVQDYDANFAAHIASKPKYKAMHEDDDEAYGLGMYENMDKQKDAKKLAARQQKQQVSEKQNIKRNLERCDKCMESRRFKLKPQIVSSSQHAYLWMDNIKECVLPGQVAICPQEHVAAITDLDDSAYTEVRNYQKCLVRYFEAQDPPLAVIFAESAIHRPSKEKLLMGAGPHTHVVAYPVELPVFSQARSFFKKAFDEAEDEWSTQHKKVIETTAKGGVRSAIPKNFPYVHIDFSLGGGYAHVVEDAEEFPKDFAGQTIAGMCELTVLDRAYPQKEQYWEAMKSMKEKFQKEFDWTQSLH